MEIKRFARLTSVLIDIITIFMLEFVLGIIIYVFVGQFTVHPDFSHENLVIHSGLIYCILLFVFILLFKDFLNGQSIGKLIMKIEIIDIKTKRHPSFIKKVLRNVTTLIAPLEVLVILFSPRRRIGDLIVGTEIVTYINPIYDPEYNIKNDRYEKNKISHNSIFILIIITLLMFIGRNMKQSLILADQEEIPFIKASLNLSESKNLEKILSDNLGSEVSADVEIFDSVRGKKIKFVSIIVCMDYDVYIIYNNIYDKTDANLRSLLKKYYPQQVASVQIKYVYVYKGKKSIYALQNIY